MTIKLIPFDPEWSDTIPESFLFLLGSFDAKNPSPLYGFQNSDAIASLATPSPTLVAWLELTGAVSFLSDKYPKVYYTLIKSESENNILQKYVG